MYNRSIFSKLLFWKPPHIQGVSEKKFLKGFLGKAGSYFPTTFFNYKLQPFSGTPWIDDAIIDK